MKTKQEIRQTIVQLYKQKFTISKIAEKMKGIVSLATVYNIINGYKQSGNTLGKQRQGKRIFTNSMKNILQEIYSNGR